MCCPTDLEQTELVVEKLTLSSVAKKCYSIIFGTYFSGRKEYKFNIREKEEAYDRCLNWEIKVRVKLSRIV
jgi:hypothetical protein